MAKALIAYPGGKWRLYEVMEEYFPEDMEVFCEPFMGGGSTTLNVLESKKFKNLQRVVVSDLFTEIYALWQGVKVAHEEMHETVLNWYKSMCPTHEEFRRNFVQPTILRAYAEGKEEGLKRFSTKEEYEYYNDIWVRTVNEGKALWDWMMSLDADQLTIGQRAARTFLVYRISFSSMGFSGTYIGDAFCKFTEETPDVIYEIHELIKNIEIYNCSYEETIKVGYDKPDKTFIFFDPPYAAQEHQGLYGMNGSTHRGFNHDKFVDDIVKLPCNWLVTYDDSAHIRKSFSKLTAKGTPCCIKPFIMPNKYTMAGKVSEDALQGEELFISNMDLFNMNQMGFDEF